MRVSKYVYCNSRINLETDIVFIEYANNVKKECNILVVVSFSLPRISCFREPKSKQTCDNHWQWRRTRKLTKVWRLTVAPIA